MNDYFKILAHEIVESGKSTICRANQQPADPGRVDAAVLSSKDPGEESLHFRGPQSTFKVFK